MSFSGFVSGDCKFLLHKSVTEIYLSMPPRENQLATKGGLRDYIMALTTDYLIAIKPTRKFTDLTIAFI